MPILNLLVTIIVLGLVFYLLYWLIGQIPMPGPFSVVAKAILAIAVVVILLSMLFGALPMPKLWG